MKVKAPQQSSDQDRGKDRETNRAVQEGESKLTNEAALERNKAVSFDRIIRHSGRIGVGLMWFFAAAFVAITSIWLLHFLTPWGWLDSNQLSKIQTVIFSGSVSAIVTTFIQKHIIFKVES